MDWATWATLPGECKLNSISERGRSIRPPTVATVDVQVAQNPPRIGAAQTRTAQSPTCGKITRCCLGVGGKFIQFSQKLIFRPTNNHSYTREGCGWGSALAGSDLVPPESVTLGWSQVCPPKPQTNWHIRTIISLKYTRSRPGTFSSICLRSARVATTQPIDANSQKYQRRCA